jgi:hypothetical protein
MQFMILAFRGDPYGKKKPKFKRKYISQIAKQVRIL